MADTIAVMNSGRIEQMGAPAGDLRHAAHGLRRELPGPVEPVPGRDRRSAGEVITVKAFGHVLTRARRRASHRAPIGSSWACVRRRCSSHRAGAERPRRATTALTGRVTDVSFVGVSTQYLVAAPWGQEIIVFEQNMSVGDRPRGGRRRCRCAGRRAHVRPRRRRRPERRHRRRPAGGGALHGRRCGGRPGPDPGRGGLTDAVPASSRSTSTIARGARAGQPRHGPAEQSRTGYLLLLPGMAWLAVFFVIPLVTLFLTCLQSPVSDNPDDGYYSTGPSPTTPRRSSSTGRSSCGRSSTRAPRRSSPWRSPTRWPTSSPSRPAGGGR